MRKPLRKSLTLELLDQVHTVEVDFRLIELMERAFNQSADMILTSFVVVEKVQRRHVADIVAEMLGRKLDVNLKRSDIREAVLTMDTEPYIALAVQIQAALLFILKHMTGEEYDQTMAQIAESRKKKTSEPVTTGPSSGPATK